MVLIFGLPFGILLTAHLALVYRDPTQSEYDVGHDGIANTHTVTKHHHLLADCGYQSIFPLAQGV